MDGGKVGLEVSDFWDQRVVEAGDAGLSLEDSSDFGLFGFGVKSGWMYRRVHSFWTLIPR